MAGQVVAVALTYVVGRALSKPQIKIWLPGLPPLEFNNPLFQRREGQRLGSLQIQETAEGAPQNRCFGPENRVAGALVWMSDLKEIKKRESGGGKGGSGGEFITYQYFAHVIVQLCRAEDPISRVPKIWADGKLVFDLDTNIDYSSNAIDALVEQTVPWIAINGIPNPSARYNLVLESDVSTPGVPDLSKLKSGNPVTIDGYGGTQFVNVELTDTPTVGSTSITLKTTSGTVSINVDDVVEFLGTDVSYSVQSAVVIGTGGGSVTIRNTVENDRPIASGGTPVPAVIKRGTRINNGTFDVVSSNKDNDPNPPQTTRVRITDRKNRFRKFTAAAAGTTVSIQQDQAAFRGSQIGSVDVLHGGADQAVPAILQQIEGDDVSQVYAMRNRSGFALTDLNLTDFGNRVPNFEALVEQQADPGQVADAILTILTKDGGWAESAVDVSGVTGEFRGYAIRGPQPPRQSLLPLMVAFDVVQWERAGKLYFANRSAIPIVDVDSSLIGAYEGGDGSNSLAIVDPPEEGLPSEVNVSYRSTDNELQQATRRSARTDGDLPVDVATVDLGALAISDDHAQQIADRLLAVAWGARRQFTVPLPPSMIGQVRNGMILRFGPVYGQTWKTYVERVDRGANDMLVASGIEYDEVLLEQSGTAEGTLGFSSNGNSQDGPHGQAAPVDLALLDIPPLLDQHRLEPGVYVAARPADTSRPWRGAVLYWSRDAGRTWNRVADIPNESVLGELVTPPATTVNAGSWDRANTIRVKITHPQVELGSVTEDACLSGANRWLVGREIIGAATITYVERDPVDGARTYDLSTLLRGLQGTDQSMEEHVAGEQVVWLDGPGVQFVELGYPHVDHERLWKLVPHGATVDDAEAVRTAVTGRNCKPFHVRDAKASRDGSNNITLIWERMTRAQRTFLEQGEPLDEEVEAYELDVVVGGVVKRTIKVSGARTTTYSAANQTTDGITPGDPVTFRIYQMSAGFLRGQESEFVL